MTAANTPPQASQAAQAAVAPGPISAPSTSFTASATVPAPARTLYPILTAPSDVVPTLTPPVAEVTRHPPLPPASAGGSGAQTSAPSSGMKPPQEASQTAVPAKEGGASMSAKGVQQPTQTGKASLGAVQGVRSGGAAGPRLSPGAAKGELPPSGAPTPGVPALT